MAPAMSLSIRRRRSSLTTSRSDLRFSSVICIAAIRSASMSITSGSASDGKVS